MRNVDVRICPVGAIALYFFERFHVDNEVFPTFESSQDWYDIKFIRAKSRTSEMTYVNHKKSYERVFNHLGLKFNKKTHINRQQGVRQLESADVDISQTRRHGRWGMDSCEAVYAAPLAREAMRALSGHPPKQRLFYLSRALIDPPQNLQQQLFPLADMWLQKIIDGDGCERNLAARGFLELLIYLRKVLIQDAAIMFDVLPEKIKCHCVFGAIFQKYRMDLLEKIQTTDDPLEMRLEMAMPILAKRMKIQHQVVMDKLDEQRIEIKKNVEETKRILTNLSVTIKYNDGVASSSIGNTTTSSSTGMQNDSQSENQEETPNDNYSLSRCIYTVKDLWKEWNHGLDGNPSVVSLENRLGTSWRASCKEMKFFSRRNVIIKYVKKLMNEGFTEQQSLSIAELERGTKSLDKFSKELSKR
jgi:hypothetical protein